MNVLLVQPSYPVTYWGFQHALSLVGKKVSLPPLGLLTVAALLPRDWSYRLIDLNAASLRDDDLAWSDVVLTGGMRVQSAGMEDVVARSHASGRPVIIGGPAVSADPSLVPEADVVFAGEAEGRAGELISVIEKLVATWSGGMHGEKKSRPRFVPSPSTHPEMKDSPIPRFDLLEQSQYISMAIQYSRGCPFSCEFCDVVSIFGRRPRVKSCDQLIAELDALQRTGYRGTLFLVDDNFIGNRSSVRELLPRLARWQRRHGNPFEFYTEASVDLSLDDLLMDEMVEAGFGAVFLGIETPSVAALEQAGKRQNLSLDLSEAVERITARGLEVMGGFIVGFDHDSPEVFELQRRFIESLPIPLAMVGLLIALPGTELWRRLEREGRLREPTSGDQFGRPNFEPAMDETELLSGYAALMKDLYSPSSYFGRCKAYLERTTPSSPDRPVRPGGIMMLLRAIYRLGLLGSRRRYFWELLVMSLRRGKASVSWATAKAIQGEHLIRYTQEDVLPRLESALEEIRE